MHGHWDILAHKLQEFPRARSELHVILIRQGVAKLQQLGVAVDPIISLATKPGLAGTATFLGVTTDAFPAACVSQRASTTSIGANNSNRRALNPMAQDSRLETRETAN